MAWEEAHRCRWWPDCQVHTGTGRLQQDVGLAERHEIIREFRAGARPSEIAAAHGLAPHQVYRIRSAPNLRITRP